MIDAKELIDKLLGPTNPVADTHVDNERLENLKAKIKLTGKLIEEIRYVASKKDSGFGSVAMAGKVADKFLDTEGIAPF